MTTATTITKDVGYTGQKPVNTQPECSEVYTAPVPINFPLAAPVANDTHALCKLLPGVQVIDFDLFLDDLDSDGSPACVLSIGELNAGLTDLAVVYMASITIGQTGGLVRFSAASAAADIRALGAATLDTERVIGVKWTTASDTYVASKTGLLALKVIG